MTPERYEQLSRAFAELCDLPLRQRAEALDQLREADPDLHGLLKVMFQCDAENHSTWNPTLARGDVDMLERRLEAAVIDFPHRFGRYTITRRIAAGATGTVYEAAQEFPRRTVALKVIHGGLPSEQMLRRFELEVEILASLDHPGIARIFDAGSIDTESGPQLYFTMELIDGMPLVDYARAKGLGLRRRLGLMIRVCDAVQYAHSRGVIHRDLKPDNILVVDTPKGPQPRIVDFGVARSIDNDFDRATRRTLAGQVIGTIAYMSPEQAEGGPRAVNASSDVYSLGVMLYQLLSSKLPHDVTGRSFPEALQLIQHEPITRLQMLHRSLGGELETIVHHALENDPARRYQTAAGLAADLRRHLRDEPILAQPPTRLYLLRKFARRNRSLIVGAAAALILLVAAVVGTSYGMIRAMHERDRAQHEADKYAEIVRLIQWAISVTSSNSHGYPKHEVTVGELLDNVAGRLERGEIMAPGVRASMGLALGGGYLGLRRYDDAETQLRTAISVLKSRDSNTIEYAQAESVLGGVMFSTGRLAEAERSYRNCLDALVGTDGVASDTAAGAGTQLGAVLARTGRFDEAEKVLRATVDDVESLDADSPWRRRLPSCYLELARTAAAAGDRTTASSAARRTNELMEQFVEPVSPFRGDLEVRLGGYYWLVADYADAAQHFRNGIDILRATGGDLTAECLNARNSLGVCLRDMGRLDEAEEVLREVLAADEPLFSLDHPFRTNVLINLAWTLYYDQRYNDAERCAAEALDRRRALGENPLEIAEAHGLLARIELADERLDDAERHLAAAQDLLHENLPDKHWLVVETRSLLGGCYALRGDYECAEPLLAEGYDAVRAHRGDAGMRTLDALKRLADFYDETGNVSAFNGCLDRLAQGRREQQGWRTLDDGPAMVFSEDGPAPDDTAPIDPLDQ